MKQLNIRLHGVIQSALLELFHEVVEPRVLSVTGEMEGQPREGQWGWCGGALS